MQIKQQTIKLEGIDISKIGLQGISNPILQLPPARTRPGHHNARKFLITKTMLQRMLGDLKLTKAAHKRLIEEVTIIVNKACRRAREEGRKSLLARDI